MKRYMVSAIHYLGMALLVMALALLSSCQDEPQAAESEAADTPTTAPTEEPEPTPSPEPTAAVPAHDMVGIWLGTLAGERGYVMYTDDGRYTVALNQDNLGSAPRVSGEYWFEDGQIHLRDLENAGHWDVCDAATVGVYEVLVLADGKIQFQTVTDGCSEGGFTRNYLFANMIQERIGDPVAIEYPNPRIPCCSTATLLMSWRSLR